VQAKFSLEYAIAARLIHGEVGIGTFTDEKVNDPRIQSFMKKVDMRIDPELEKLGFIGTAPIRMRVKLIDGETISLANDLAMGNPEKPLTPAKFEKKFMNCVVPGAGNDAAQRWWTTLQTLESASIEAVASLGALS
jgi:2-methylcitrate dehydratase PrpD